MNRIILLLAAVTFAHPLSGQTAAHRIGQVIQRHNSTIAADIIPFAHINVCANHAGCDSVAVYQDDTLTTQAQQPLTADGEGYYDFWIAPGCYKEQILTIGQSVREISGVCLSAPSGGAGGFPAAPNYSVQVNGGGGAFAGDPTFTFNTSTKAVTSKIANGLLNPDQYATGAGNNGIANAQASSDCVAGCSIAVPQTSTSTESASPTVNNTHVQDFRKGSQGDWFYNPAAGGAAGFNPRGQPSSVAKTLYATWDAPTQAPDFSQAQTGSSTGLNFNSKGWDFGTDTGYNGPLWSATLGSNISMSTSTPGISHLVGGDMHSYRVGDTQVFAYYSYPDGGFIDGGGEGSSGGIVHRDQPTAWFHGTANAGSTTGSQMLQTTYVAGATSRQQYSIGGSMLDISRLAATQHVTGPAVQVPGYAVFATPVDFAVTPSTAWGIPNAAIPAPVNPIIPQSDTVIYTVAGGTNAGGYTAGVACLAGQQLNEQVMITAVGVISGGVQSVTFTHRYPNAKVGSSLWQGGPCGMFYVPSVTYLQGWDVAYPIVGATDSSHIVGSLPSGSATKLPIPNFWTPVTANVPLQNLSAVGTTVTATLASSFPLQFNNISGAVVSGATNGTFNGTTGNITVTASNKLTWTQSGPSGTSASGLISLPISVFQFYMIPGAQIAQPCTALGCPLEPNTVPWTSGDNVENPLNPSFAGNMLTLESDINSPDASTGGLNISVGGAGVNGKYTAFDWQNNSPNTQYTGSGGKIAPPTLIRTHGATSAILNAQYAPIDGSAVFFIGCAVPQQGGCNSLNDIRAMGIGNSFDGVLAYTPSHFYNFQKLSAALITRSPVLSTGLGRLGNNPVALTSSNNLQNDDVMGTYAAFGNEALLDTSATIAAKSYYAGLVYAGALPPTINGVLVVGTPGSTTYSYIAKSVTQAGESLPSVAATTTTGNATLSGTNYNSLNITPGYGTQSTNVYRTTAPAGLICANVSNFQINGTGATGSAGAGCADTGQAILGPLTANVDASGSVQSPSGTFANSLTVAGQNVCQANGTNCPSIPSITKGRATLTSGTFTVSTASATTSGVYTLTNCGVNASTAVGTLAVGTITAGTSFVINSESATATIVTGDASTVCWSIQ